MGKNYPYELTLDEFEDFIGDTGAEFIHFDDEERGDGYEMVIIEDNQKRRIAAIEFVKENVSDSEELESLTEETA